MTYTYHKLENVRTYRSTGRFRPNLRFFMGIFPGIFQADGGECGENTSAGVARAFPNLPQR